MHPLSFIRAASTGPLSRYKVTTAAIAVLLVSLSLIFATSAFAEVRYVPDGMWGAPGEFNMPMGIALDSSSNVFVVDAGHHQIQKFDPDGNFITKWGSHGYGDYQFDGMWGVGVDATGNSYVADSMNNARIQKFDSFNFLLGKWGSWGSGDGQFRNPADVAIHDGFAYVTDGDNNRIEKFTTDGAFITSWGGPGGNDGQFNSPRGLAVDSDGNVYVADMGNHRIQIFSSDGAFIASWGGYGDSADRKFNSPQGIAVDKDGNIYVADTGNCRIQKLAPDGTFLTKWGTYGSAPGQLHTPIDVAVNGDGEVYVSELWTHRIQKFRPAVCDRPLLELSTSGATWASYADYLERKLSLGYSVSNPSGADAFDATITGSSATEGVTVMTVLPSNLGDIAPGGVLTGQLAYYVPAGVAFFHVTVQASADDACGTGYDYPAPV